MQPLRFTTCGDVDAGKSTLIGQLLSAAHALPSDQRVFNNEFAHVTDGLAEERRSGITIDVAYRYFETVKRKFIVADAPGHLAYTPNMYTAASNSDVAILLVDATQPNFGITEQTSRHAAVIASLTQAKIVVAINKLDCVEDPHGVYQSINHRLREMFGLRRCSLTMSVIPVSALRGDNVVNKSEAWSWYGGPTLLDYLQHVKIERLVPPYMSVQCRVGDCSFGSYYNTFSVGDSVWVNSHVRPSYLTRVLSAFREGDSSWSVQLQEPADVGEFVWPEFIAHVRECTSRNACILLFEPFRYEETYRIRVNDRWGEIKLNPIPSHFDFKRGDWDIATEANSLVRVSVKGETRQLLQGYREFIVVDPRNSRTVAAGLFE